FRCLFGVRAVRAQSQIFAELLVGAVVAGELIAQQDGQRVVRFGVVRSFGQQPLQLLARAHGVAGRGIERAEQVTELVIFGVAAQVIFRVLGGGAVTLVADAHLDQQREQLCLVRALGARRRQVLLGARVVADRGEALRAAYQARRRGLALGHV